MPNRAKSYVAWVIATGAMLFVTAFAHWECADPLRFTTYLVLALVAATLKIRLPGMQGTYSLTFLFVLIGVADLTFAETAVIGALSMIVQSVWRPAERPRRAQVAFNAAAVVISVALSFLVVGSTAILPLRIALAATAYYLTNVILVSVVVALVDHASVKKVWSQWFEWSFRYYLAGVAIASVIIACNRYLGWTYSLLMLPLMYAEYFGYRITVGSQSRKALPGGPVEQP